LMKILDASEKPWTEKLWIYDLRTNKPITSLNSILVSDYLLKKHS